MTILKHITVLYCEKKIHGKSQFNKLRQQVFSIRINIALLLFALLIFTNCKNREETTKKVSQGNIEKTGEIIPQETEIELNPKIIIPEVRRTVYVTAKNGLNYRKSNDIDAEVLGKFPLGHKLEIIVENKYGTYFSVDDPDRGSISGKWVGVKLDSSTVYVFDAYLYPKEEPINPYMEEHLRKVGGVLEAVFQEQIQIENDLDLVIEKHLQTSSHFSDYSIVKLISRNDTIFSHRINYLFKDSYELKKIDDKEIAFRYRTLFDECPSREYEQLFKIVGKRIQKIDESYREEHMFIETLPDGYKLKKYNESPYTDFNLSSITTVKQFGENALESGAFGQWFFFEGDATKWIHKTGFYKDGLKDSIWIATYEDHPMPTIEFYKHGSIKPYQGKIAIYDDEGRLWFKSDNLKTESMPKGVMQFYRYDVNKIMEYEFKEVKDSIEVFTNVYNLKTGELQENYQSRNAKDDEWN
ncbi:hypothetical protein ACNR9Q_05995 [Maribacter sp. X9]|uniref:hypothetical protein n=1 Tax=Maribacter sp. X9 TaxID=3402159 RepID=UPI003AF389B9